MIPSSSTADLKTHKANLFELLSLWIASVSLSSITLFALSLFNPLHAIFLGTFLFLLFIDKLNISCEWKDKNLTIALLFILIFAFFLRTNPYLWIMGEQDQGIYVNMSATYEKAGKAFITDTVRETLSDTEKETYDATNHYKRFKIKTTELRGFHQPGVYINDLEKSEYVFQFYPMHPLWISIFGEILGSVNRVYSVVFFSLISILAFYFIALELTKGNRKTAYLIALFLAVNPLHTFFAKFPVSETASLAFSSTGFYFLLKYYNQSKEENYNFWYLLGSAGLFLGLFLNHISGFLYLPIFYLLILISIIFANNRTMLRHLLLYGSLVFLAYFISIAYGLTFSAPYFWQIGNGQFGQFLGKTIWDNIIISLFFVALLTIPLTIFLKKHLQLLIPKIIPLVKKLLPLIFYTFIVISLYQVYQLAFTDKWIGNTNVDKIYHLANQGITSILGTQLAGIIYYLTPIGFILFLMAINFLRKTLNATTFLLYVFLIIAFIMRLIMKPVLLYEYYYARYLLEEIVPYGLLIISIYLVHLHQKNKLSRIFAIISSLAILLYSLYFTSFQLLGHETNGVIEPISKISEQVHPNDIILLSSAHLIRTLATPLSYYFHQNIAATPYLNQINWDTFFLNYNNVYLISSRALPYNNFSLINTFDYYEEIMEHSNLIPTSFTKQNKLTLFLYRIKEDIQQNNIFFVGGILKPFLFEKTDFLDEGDFSWTLGDGVLKKIGYKLSKKDHHLALHLNSYNPYEKDLEKLQLHLYVNEVELALVRQANLSYIFKLPKNFSFIDQIRIKSATFNPKEMGISNTDNRTLGVSISSIEIVE